MRALQAMTEKVVNIDSSRARPISCLCLPASIHSIRNLFAGMHVSAAILRLQQCRFRTFQHKQRTKTQSSAGSSVMCEALT